MGRDNPADWKIKVKMMKEKGRFLCTNQEQIWINIKIQNADRKINIGKRITLKRFIYIVFSNNLQLCNLKSQMEPGE